MVAAADPCRLVGGVEQGMQLGVGEERDERLVVALGRDRQDALDRVGVGGRARRGVAAGPPTRPPRLRPARLGRMARAVAAADATPTPLGREVLEREVLLSAEQLASQLDGGGEYAAALARRCAAVEGTTAPLTASHNDLTMWNVLIDDDGRLAIVDWEVAEEDTLPLKDLPYAIVDASVGDRSLRRPPRCLRRLLSAPRLVQRGNGRPPGGRDDRDPARRA